jgi:Mor family transcriptional regulator
MDILTDIAERFVAAGACPQITGAVIDAIRKDWGGENAYVAKRDESPRQIISRRNSQLLRDWQRGERVPHLARKYAISVKRVYAVVKLSRASLKGKT